MLFAFLPGLIASEIVAAQAGHKRTLAEDARLRSLPPEQQAFELRLREVKALEAQARVRPVINVRSSIF